MTKIVAISDLHGFQNELQLPDADILVIAGDLTMRGTPSQIMEVSNWITKIEDQFKHIIVIAGNHDFLFQNHSSYARSILHNDKLYYLQDKAVTVEGLKFYGSPYSNMFNNWAFMEEDGELVKRWAMIPDDTEVLITHGPAYGILDKIDTGESVGSKALYERIKQLKSFKVHIVGHIHEGFGHERIDNVDFYNVSVVDRYYRVHNPPTVIVL